MGISTARGRAPSRPAGVGRIKEEPVVGLIQAFSGAIGGTFADQWKDIITAGPFDDRTVVAPGLFRQSNAGRGVNRRGSVDVISNGSKIFVPENTAALIFGEGGVEEIVTDPGGYEYFFGQASVFAGDGVVDSLFRQAAERFGYGGQTADQKWVSFVNLRELRGLKFGTRAPMAYHDLFYNADLELTAFGSFALQVVDPVTFVRNFLPANSRHYSFDSPGAQEQISAEFLQAFITAVNALSRTRRLPEMPAHAGEIAHAMADDSGVLGSWITRYGLDLVNIGIESIEFSPSSREIVRQFASSRLSVSAYEGISQQASNVLAQQRIAQGIQDHGLGDAAGLAVGLGVVNGLNPFNAAPVGSTTVDGSVPAPSLAIDDQIEAVKKLKELVDAGILTEEEFQAKKKQVMGL